jgi:hypothetical protein
MYTGIYFGRVSNACCYCGTHHVTFIENLVTSHETGNNDRIVNSTSNISLNGVAVSSLDIKQQ